MSKSRSRQYAETLLRSFDLAYQFRFVSGLPSCSDHSKGCRSDLWKKMGLLKSPSLHIRNRGNTVSSLQAVSRMKVCPGVSSNNWDFFLGGVFTVRWGDAFVTECLVHLQGGGPKQLRFSPLTEIRYLVREWFGVLPKYLRLVMSVGSGSSGGPRTHCSSCLLLFFFKLILSFSPDSHEAPWSRSLWRQYDVVPLVEK